MSETNNSQIVPYNRQCVEADQEMADALAVDEKYELILDCSASMQTPVNEDVNRFDLMIKFLQSTLLTQPPGRRISIRFIGDIVSEAEVFNAVELTAEMIASVDAMIAKAMEFNRLYGGGTVLYSGLLDVANSCPKGSQMRLITFTDGGNNLFSTRFGADKRATTFADAVKALDDNGIRYVFILVAFGSQHTRTANDLVAIGDGVVHEIYAITDGVSSSLALDVLNTAFTRIQALPVNTRAHSRMPTSVIVDGVPTGDDAAGQALLATAGFSAMKPSQKRPAEPPVAPPAKKLKVGLLTEQLPLLFLARDKFVEVGVYGEISQWPLVLRVLACVARGQTPEDRGNVTHFTQPQQPTANSKVLIKIGADDWADWQSTGVITARLLAWFYRAQPGGTTHDYNSVLSKLLKHGIVTLLKKSLVPKINCCAYVCTRDCTGLLEALRLLPDAAQLAICEH